jgi:hypothetical protein
MLHICADIYDVTENLKNFLHFAVNMALVFLAPPLQLPDGGPTERDELGRVPGLFIYYCFVGCHALPTPGPCLNGKFF